MKRQTITLLLFIFAVTIAVVLFFIYPSLSNKDPHHQANQLLEQGIECEINEDYTCAKDQYQQAIKTYSQDSRYYFRLAKVQTRLGNYVEAITNYQQAKALNPSDENVLPALNTAISGQATQTAIYMPIATNLPTDTPTVTPTPVAEDTYLIFDESFGVIKSVTVASQSPNDEIQYRISEEEAYSGTHSLLVDWTKNPVEWASLILGFDLDINNRAKAEAGQMAMIDLTPPSKYAIQFYAKGVTGGESFALKFQDQNLLYKESLGNQAVYIYKKNPQDNDVQPDGLLSLTTDWQEFCLPLAAFDTDYWIKQTYSNFTNQDLQFDWSKVKQINIDSGFYLPQGGIYIDDMRIIQASDCIPYGY